MNLVDKLFNETVDADSRVTEAVSDYFWEYN